MAQGARSVLGERVAVALAVRSAQEGGHDVEIPLGDIGRLPPQIGETEVDVELEEVDPRRVLGHADKVETASDGMGAIKFGPARMPSRESPEAAIDALLARGLSACEVDFEGKFWMDYDFAARLGALARDAGVALSVHAPLAGFMGHAERGKKLNMAIGMLDHSAGIAAACDAELVVFHPGFLLGRTREEALASIVEQLAELRERLEKKDRAVPFGVEVMGRVREIGSLEDVIFIASQLHWVRPVLDFAHMHATSDGAFVGVDPFAAALEAADGVLEQDAPFHIHFSDIQYANRNETKHLPYGEGTLRAEPLRDALARFERPATVISESPNVESTQAIGIVLGVL
ncbi:MAG TPA: TIM barrel protein [Gaiellaceae bacterium]